MQIFVLEGKDQRSFLRYSLSDLLPPLAAEALHRNNKTHLYSVTDSCDVKILNCANHHGDVNSLKSPNHQRALSHCKEQHKDPQTSAATQLTCLLPLTVSLMAGVKHRHMPLPHDLNIFEVAWASMFDHLLLLPSYS